MTNLLFQHCSDAFSFVTFVIMFYQDLSKLNRKPEHVLYISAHALESCLQLENCVSIKPWKLETDDTQLLDLIPFLECKCSKPIFCISMRF
jgi:TFIIF-interacting CTD phosphatase-like protein